MVGFSKHKSRTGPANMSSDTLMHNADNDERTAGNGLDYFEKWPPKFDFGAPENTYFWPILGHFLVCPKVYKWYYSAEKHPDDVHTKYVGWKGLFGWRSPPTFPARAKVP